MITENQVKNVLAAKIIGLMEQRDRVNDSLLKNGRNLENCSFEVKNNIKNIQAKIAFTLELAQDLRVKEEVLDTITGV